MAHSSHPKYVHASQETVCSSLRLYITSSRRWVLGDGMKLKVVKCCNNDHRMSREQETRVGNLETLSQLTAHRPHQPLVEKMAFQNSGSTYPCGNCGNKYPFFKMVTSERLEHLRISFEEDGDGERQGSESGPTP